MKDAEIDLRRIFALVWRRIPLISAIAAAVVAVAIVAIFMLPPVYSATSLIVFDPIRKDLLDPSAQSSSGSADNARIESEVELLRSDSILLKVIASQNLLPEGDAAPGLRARVLAAIGLASAEQPLPEQRFGQALAQLRRSVLVQRRGLTYLIAVQARSNDPVKAANLANAIAQTYIDDQVASKVNAMLSSRDVLQARLADARDEIVASEAAFNAFMQQSTTQLAHGPDGADVQRLTGEMDALTVARDKARHLADTVQTSLSSMNWEGLATALAEDDATVLSQQRQALAQQIASLDANSPAATDLQNQLASLERQMRQSADVQLASLRTHVADLDTRRLALQDELRTEVMGSELPADILTGLFDLQSKAAFAREQYQLLLSRSLQLENRSNLQVADSRIASPALPPSSHSFPNATIFLGAAVLFGLGLGVSVSAVYESVVGGFMSQEQLEAALRTRVAATIPRLKLPNGNDTLADLVITAPLSQFSEAMRRTQMTIDQTVPEADQLTTGLARIIMVTSAVPSEGKSTIAMALARSYALSGRRTLLMECDLRQPSLGRELDAKPRAGLLEILTSRNGSVTLSDCIQHEPDTKLSLLLGHRGTDRPTDTLLGSVRFQRLIEEAAKTFEIVVLDTPPVEPVIDALYMAPLANIIILVTRWGSTAQRESKRALASLTQAKNSTGRIISVLNAKDQPKASHRQEYKRYYDADYA